MSDCVKAMIELLESLQDDLVDPGQFAAEFREEYRGGSDTPLPDAVHQALRRTRERNPAKYIPLRPADPLVGKVPAHIISLSWTQADKVALWAGTLDRELNEKTRRQILLTDVIANRDVEFTSWIGASLYIACETEGAVVDVDISEFWPTDANPEHLLWVEIKGELGSERIALSPNSPVVTVSYETVGHDAAHWQISMGLMPCR